MRVVLDTNVIISALMFGGTPQKVLDLIRVFELELILSPFILEEVDEVLKKKFQWPASQRYRVQELLRQQATIVTPTTIPKKIKACKADNQILACAEATDADVLVTGDKKHLLPLKKWKGTRITDPSEFLELLGM